MRIALTVLVTVLVSACSGGGGGSTTSSGSPAPVLATITGTVLDKHAAPVAGATVSVFHHNTNTTVTATTDALGHYSVAGLDTLSNSDYAIYVERAGNG